MGGERWEATTPKPPRRGPRRLPAPPELLARLTTLTKRAPFRSARERFYFDLLRLAISHRPGDFLDPRGNESAARWTANVWSVLIHPTGVRVVPHEWQVLVFGYNLLVAGFCEKWGVWPPHPALVFDFTAEPWRQTMYAPRLRPIIVFPWTTRAGVLAEFKAIRRALRPAASRPIPDRRELLTEFLAAHGYDAEAIARTMAPGRRTRLGPSFAAEQASMRRLLARGLSYRQADVAVRKAARRESPAAARVRKRLERLAARLQRRLALILPRPHFQR